MNIEFNRIDKIQIAKFDKNYIMYHCSEHGVFQLSKDFNSGECPWCHIKCRPIKNIDQLQAKFKNELHLAVH